MKNDVEDYIERRKRNDKAFAKDFDAGYEEFNHGWTQTRLRCATPRQVDTEKC